MPRVRHNRRRFKQMALEVAVRNPERYESILKTFSEFEGKILDPEGILDIYVQLYLDGAVKSNSVTDDMLEPSIMREWVLNNCSHRGEWGFPTGYQAAFMRYLRTLSEFGFIYSQYEEPLLLSPIAKVLLSGKISLSEAFAVQSMRYWRKSPYRRVLNDFNFFSFIMDVIIKLNEEGRRLSYCQFMVSLFSDDGDIDYFINQINNNRNKIVHKMFEVEDLNSLEDLFEASYNIHEDLLQLLLDHYILIGDNLEDLKSRVDWEKLLAELKSKK